MGKKNKFNYFKAYEKLTALAVQESDLMIETLRSFKDAEALQDAMVPMHEFENQGDDINHAIFESAAVDFMPPIDREDVVELASALDNVLDYIDDVIAHMYMYSVKGIPDNAMKMAGLIRDSVKALDKMICEFHNFKKNKKFRQLLVDINSFEEQADQLYTEAMHHLHTKENAEVMHVLVWSRIYERMEKCCDACEHAADIVSTIVLKNM